MQFLLNTLILASVYGLLALGYVVVYRASRVINMAHGEFMMLGGYFAYSILSLTGMKGVVGAIGSTIIALIMSILLVLLIYRIFIHKLLGQSVIAIVMVTIGLSIVLRGLATFIWGAIPVYLISLMKVGNPSIQLIGGMRLSRFDLISILIYIICLTSVAFFYKYTKAGVHMRAVSENPLLAAQRGVNIYAQIAIAWIMASVFAPLSGILYGANFHLEPEVGFLGLKAISVALVGGMYSISGITPAALIVAVSENALAQFYNPLLAGVVPMAILLLTLIIRPWGIFGKEEEIGRV